MGSPGKVVRILSDEERAGLEGAAQHYVGNARYFRDQLRPDPRFHG
jgi:carbonic anhydrase/acetyltransferase-like protein (isoleucine patch superfamily)